MYNSQSVNMTYLLTLSCLHVYLNLIFCVRLHLYVLKLKQVEFLSLNFSTCVG